MITQAESDDDRREVLEHFLSTFDDIDSQAVPLSCYDDLYDPVVAVYRANADGPILGAALTCRSQVAVGSVVAQRRGLALPASSDFTSVLGKHSELDLISVLPCARNRGIGSQLMSYLEQQLQSRGVRIWFGHVTSDLDNRLRSFYTTHGFNVTDAGQPLPPLLGRNWMLPTIEPALFSFYKRI